MTTLLNIFWFIFLGFVTALGWFLAGVLMFVSIIGIPFGIQHLKIASLALLPIGKEIVDVRSAAQ